MEYFSEVEEGAVITVSGGVYRQSKAFKRAGKLYAKHGAGYVRLLQGGSTTKPTLNWIDIDILGQPIVEKNGWVQIDGGENG